MPEYEDKRYEGTVRERNNLVSPHTETPFSARA
jgi:hypothetical protein